MTTIFFENIPVATVRARNENVSLVYEKSWLALEAAFPISFSMPLHSRAYGGEQILPWLANLLPESNLSKIGQQLGVSPQDILGILSEIGRDTAGALSIGIPRTGDDAFRVVPNDSELERILDELPNKPFLVGEEGVSMSLAGAQDKIGVFLVEGKVAIPIEGTPSTHILKPDFSLLKGSVQNEAFCMTLANLCGLETASVTTGKAGARSYILVTRYDRHVSPTGVQRIHQEDLAQMLGYFPANKYEFGGPGGWTAAGPTLKKMFVAIADHISPGARLSLLDKVIFNVIVCNTDAHAKNYSVLIGAGGTAKLAPLYDVLCGAAWPKITKRMAQRINGKHDATTLTGSDWQAFAKDVGLSPARTIKRIVEIGNLVERNAVLAKQMVAEMPAGDHFILDQCRHEVTKRARRIIRQISSNTLASEDEVDEAATLSP